jgi:hypothetical protein
MRHRLEKVERYQLSYTSFASQKGFFQIGPTLAQKGLSNFANLAFQFGATLFLRVDSIAGDM